MSRISREFGVEPPLNQPLLCEKSPQQVWQVWFVFPVEKEFSAAKTAAKTKTTIALQETNASLQCSHECVCFSVRKCAYRCSVKVVKWGGVLILLVVTRKPKRCVVFGIQDLYHNVLKIGQCQSGAGALWRQWNLKVLTRRVCLFTCSYCRDLCQTSSWSQCARCSSAWSALHSSCTSGDCPGSSATSGCGSSFFVSLVRIPLLNPQAYSSENAWPQINVYHLSCCAVAKQKFEETVASFSNGGFSF